MSNSQSAQFDSPRAWLVVAGGFLACFVVFGVLYSFGVFLKPMKEEFGVSHAVMSTLFAFMSLLSYLLGPFTGKLADRIGPRTVVFAAAVLMAAGLLIAPYTSGFTSTFICLGVGIGGGIACGFVPGMAAVGEWFKKNRDLALGIAISGIGCGTLAAAPLAAALIRDYGWRHTMTLFGIASGLLLLVSALLMKTPPLKTGQQAGSGDILGKVRTPCFLLFYISLVMAGISIFIAIVYLPALATAEGISRVQSAALVGYIGGASVVSRIGLDFVAEKLGIMTIFQFSFACVCGACILWQFVYSDAALAFFAMLLGIGYGGVAALTPAVLAHIYGLPGFGELLGILLTAFGVASVAGPPLAGYLVDRSGNYRDIVVYAIATSIVALATSLALRRFAAVAETAKSAQTAA